MSRMTSIKSILYSNPRVFIVSLSMDKREEDNNNKEDDEKMES